MAHVSFEYFPGRTQAAQDQLAETVSLLAQYQPEFQSVTYGAGGSERETSFDAALAIRASSGIPTASHLTYTGSSKDEIKAFADKLWEAGITRIVALRGDPREGKEALPFADTPAFVEALKSFHPFEIAVACYPETHPRAKSREDDLAILKAKQDAGATFAITQFFFDNRAFYDFVAHAREAGINIPIVPGILPIYNFARVCQMAKACGTAIPEFVFDAFANGKVCGSSDLEIASELLKSQLHDLAYAGFESVHIYTLNRAPLAQKAAGAFLDAHDQLINQRRVA